MPWFIPLGLGLGLMGTRTAALFRKIWGQGRRRDLVALMLVSWAPLAVWLLAALFSLMECP